MLATTTPLWWTILNNLKEEWRTDNEIRDEIENLWYNADEYLWKKETNNIYQDIQNNKSSWTTTWQKIINILRDKWLTDKEIRESLESLWYDSNEYFWDNNQDSNNNLFIKISNKTPNTDDRIKLIISINENYNWNVYFTKLQYYDNSSENRINIDTESNRYISDYWDSLKIGYIKFSSSDKWNITISKFVKFSKSGKYKIYAKDNNWDEDYVQFTVKSENYKDDENNKDFDNSRLTLSTNSSNFSINEPISISIRTNDYIGNLSLYAKYREVTSNYRITLTNTSTEYVWDYSDIWENWYYKMTSSDNGKKILSNLVKLKKSWTYRIYAEDNNWYNNFVQIYVNSNNTTTNDSNDIITNNNNSDESSYKNNEINKLLKEILGVWNDNSSNTNIENNKNIKDSNEEVYLSRNCKQYRIQLNQWSWVYTSPDLQKNEYFINKEYLKRYIDSKNSQKSNCPNNKWRINTFYDDKSNNSEYYIAPNWKVYFIENLNWSYTSKQFSKTKNFWTIDELKKYIRNNNSLTFITSNN